MAMIYDSIVRARIPSDVKEKATLTLEQMGINLSDLIRMLLFKVASEGKVPFSLQLPTAEGIKETEYLLSNPVNAERLRKSMEHARQGIVEYHDDDLVDDEDEDEDEEP